MLRLPKWIVVVLALAFLVALAAPTMAADTKGKIKSVAADKQEFVLTDTAGKEWTFQMDKDAKIRLGDKDVTLKELKANDEVDVKYEKVGEKLIAKEIICKK